MPSHGIIKIYCENSFYHLYNRGHNKNEVFKDQKDYSFFLQSLWKYIKEYQNPFLYPTPEFELHAFCLMPNHFHFLIKQRQKNMVTTFMKRLMTKYAMYFNKRHHHIGSLFQSRYKAKLVADETYLLHLSRYIHTNPAKIWGKPLHAYPFSSYGTYLNFTPNPHLTTSDILSFFQTAQKLSLKDQDSYQSFVESYTPTDSGPSFPYPD